MRLLRIRPYAVAGARQVRWGVDLFMAAVVVSVALALAGLTWRLAGYTGEMPVAVPVVAHTGGEPADVGGIVALAPFGTAMAASQASGSGTIKLKGILLAYPASASTALIAGSDGKVDSYGIGAAINGGVIDAIEADQVIIRMPGGLQTLGFALGAPGQAATVGSSIPAGSPLAPPVGKPAPTMGPAGPVAALDSGGFRIGPSSPPALFAAGLRPGDVVEQLNGNAVNGSMNERDLIARAAQTGSAQVVVVRNGQRVSLSLAIH
ncbi:type II secretion system protein N [Novosphingobium sp.]|uniref:type II secretion system protein N n=1 Tax=Novosphingobium sp. TaxID=1874826 RepID=UPI003D0ED767